MSQGPWTPKWEKIEIANVYYELTKGSKNTTAPAVHRALEKKLRAMGRWDNYPISLRMVQSIVTDLRRPKPISEDEKYDDAEWNLGLSKQLKLSPEASGDLLGVWAFCLPRDTEFTVRQAKWVCYLRSTRCAIQGQRKLIKNHLWYFSLLYAHRERICRALNIELDTTDLDILIGLTKVEINTARRVGVLDNKQLNTLPNALPEAGIPEVYGIRKPIYHALTDFSDDSSFVASIENLEDSGEVTNILVYWQRYIWEAPKYATLSEKEQRDINSKLIQYILAAQKNKSSGFFKGEWEPTEILRSVGYQIDDDITKTEAKQ